MSRHEDATCHHARRNEVRCGCGWEGGECDAASVARLIWLEHAVEAYQDEDDDLIADAEALAGDPVAGVEVRE